MLLQIAPNYAKIERSEGSNLPVFYTSTATTDGLP